MFDFDELEQYNIEEIGNKVIQDNAYQDIRKAIKVYGLEYTEDKIKEIYQNKLKIQEILLKTLYEIWKRINK